MFPIGYYSIEEAAEYLSKALNQPINYKDVVDIAANGRIRFCKRFNESLSKFSIVNGTLKCEGEYGFRGVIGILAERILPTLNELITPDRDKITFSTIKQIIEIERLNHKKYDPRLIEHGAWLGKKKINKSPWDKPEQEVFIVNLHEVYVPEQDLLDFIAENKAERSLTNKDTSAIKITPETESDRTNTKKLRRNSLDPAINKAIKNAGNTIPAYVWLALKELALSEEKPFSGITGTKGLEYTSDNDEKKYLSKDALRKRLKRQITDV